MAALETWLLDNDITDAHEKALCSRAWLAALSEVALNSSHNSESMPCFYCSGGKDIVLVKGGLVCCPNCKRVL